MSKDEIIAMLRVTITELQADKARLLDMLQLALDGQHDAEADLQRIKAGNRERQTRRRSRDSNVTDNVTVTPLSRDSNATSHVTVTLRGDYRGEDPVDPSGSTELTFPEATNPVEPLTPGESREGSRDSNVTDPQWDTFRATYPKFTQRTQWTITRRRWNALTKAERALALIGVPNYAACRAVAEGAEMAAQRWLNERWWESWQEPEKPITVLHPNGHKPDAHTVVEGWLAKHREPADVIDVTPL